MTMSNPKIKINQHGLEDLEKTIAEKIGGRIEIDLTASREDQINAVEKELKSRGLTVDRSGVEQMIDEAIEANRK
jgi:hypothetical protein